MNVREPYSWADRIFLAGCLLGSVGLWAAIVTGALSVIGRVP